MKMQMKQQLNLDMNVVKIYDLVSHRTFYINRRDVDVKRSKIEGRPEAVFDNITGAEAGVQAYLYVHSRAKNKTPSACCYFVVSENAYKRFTSLPRDQW